jgi:hypothetical protein
MDPNIEDILLLAERVTLHSGHEIPPEVRVMDQLQRMIDRFREEHGMPKPVKQALSGTT